MECGKESVRTTQTLGKHTNNEQRDPRPGNTNPQPLTTLATAPPSWPHRSQESLENNLSHFWPPWSTTNTCFVIKGHFVHFLNALLCFVTARVTVSHSLPSADRTAVKRSPSESWDRPTKPRTDWLSVHTTDIPGLKPVTVSSQPPDHASPLGSETKVGVGKNHLNPQWSRQTVLQNSRCVAVHSVQVLKLWAKWFTQFPTICGIDVAHSSSLNHCLKIDLNWLQPKEGWSDSP